MPESLLAQTWPAGRAGAPLMGFASPSALTCHVALSVAATRFGRSRFDLFAPCAQLDGCASVVLPGKAPGPCGFSRTSAAAHNGPPQPARMPPAGMAWDRSPSSAVHPPITELGVVTWPSRRAPVRWDHPSFAVIQPTGISSSWRRRSWGLMVALRSFVPVAGRLGVFRHAAPHLPFSETSTPTIFCRGIVRH